MNDFTQKMLDFINESPTCFQAVQNIAQKLQKDGFCELNERKKWKIEAGKKYFVKRNASSIIAFAIPKEDFCGFSMVASHSDSPLFKIKENPNQTEAGVVRLNAEKYGGMLLFPWFDRPLSVAGRVAVFDENAPGKIASRLVDLKKNVALIPNLAIHFDRTANDGRKIDVQNEMQSVISLENGESILSLVSKSLKIDESKILSTDLFLYNAQNGTFFGTNDEFITSPRLDDLECVWTTLLGFLDSLKSLEKMQNVPIFAVFDNEEVGSGTRQGAASTFLLETLKRVSMNCKKDEESFFVSLANSFLVSADNAHAIHPAHTKSSDPVNAPKINAGPVIKLSAAQKYTTDAISFAVFRRACENANVPFQVFTNNSNVAGGSTLGNISQTHVSVRSVDVGLSQWAMHSPMESAGAHDPQLLYKSIEEFYKIEEFPED